MWWGARKAEMCTRSVGSDAMAKSKHLLKFTRKLKPLRREHRHHEMRFAALEARAFPNEWKNMHFKHNVDTKINKHKRIGKLFLVSVKCR